MIDAAYPLARKILFSLDAEVAHHTSMAGLRFAEKTGLLELLSKPFPESDPIELMGLKFPNRIGLAAGLDKEGNTIDALGRLGFGFVEIGTITPRPQAGNPKPRLFRLIPHEAIINRMGFNNPGIDAGVENVRAHKSFTGPIGFNIGKNKDTPNENAADDYLACLEKAYPVADYIAVNLSSPNTPGLRDLQAADATARLLELLKTSQEKLVAKHGKHVPILFKVAPDLEPQQVTDLAKAFLDGGFSVAQNLGDQPRGGERSSLGERSGRTFRETGFRKIQCGALGLRLRVLGKNPYHRGGWNFLKSGCGSKIQGRSGSGSDLYRLRLPGSGAGAGAGGGVNIL